MKNTDKVFSAALVWQSSIKTAKTLKKYLQTIFFYFILGPCFIYLSATSLLSSQHTDKIRTSAENLLRPEGQAPHFHEVLNHFSSFLWLFIGTSIAFFICILVPYFALLQLSLAAIKEQQLPNFKKVMRSAFKTLLPKGFFLFLLIGFISFEQYIFGPFRIFTMFALMSPVLLFTERKSLFSSLRCSLTLRFHSPNTQGRFAIAMVLVSFGASIFLIESFFNVLSYSLLRLDEYLDISRTLWSSTINPSSISFIGLCLFFIKLLTCSIIFLFIPIFTSCLYVEATRTPNR